MRMTPKIEEVCRRVWHKIGDVGYSVGSWYGYCAVEPEARGKQNYSVKQWLPKAGDCVKYLKDNFPFVKYVQSSYGRILFYIDDTQIVAAVEQQIADREAVRLAKLNAVDLTPYVPTQKVIDKLIGYFQKGSKVNCAAIKDTVKWLTYYYAAHMLDWGDLMYRLGENDLGRWNWQDHNGVDFEIVRDAIALRVQPVLSLKRTKSEDRLLNLSKKVYQVVKDSGLDFDLEMVTPTSTEYWKDLKNGCAYTIAYELTVNNKKVRFSDVTNEGGGTFGYQFTPCGYLMNKSEFETRLLSKLELA